MIVEVVFFVVVVLFLIGDIIKLVIVFFLGIKLNNVFRRNLW